MPITYDAGTNTITVVGFSESSPCTFEDIYQADQNNGWGVFHKIGNGSYYSQAHINIGDGSTPTHFSANNVSIEFDNSMISSSNRNFMLDTANVNISFTDCNFLFKGTLTTWGRLNLMRANATRCSFINDQTLDLMVILNQVIQCLGKNVLFQPYGDVDYVFTYGKMFDARVDTIDIRNVFIFNSSTCLRTMNSNAVVQNVRGYNNTYCYYSALSSDIPRTRHMINCYFDNWAIRLHTGTHSNDYAIFYRQYEIFLRTVNKDGDVLSGLRVEIYEDGNKVEEIVSGTEYQKITLTYAKIDFKEKFPSQIGTNSYINATDDDWDYYGPFTIKVWNGPELLYEGVLKDADYVNNPPAYIDIVVEPSSLTLTDVLSELQSHRNATEAALAAVKGQTDKLQFDGANNVQARVNDKGVLNDPSAAEIDAQLSTNHGSGSWEGSSPDEVADAVWDEPADEHNAPGSFGEELKKGDFL